MQGYVPDILSPSYIVSSIKLCIIAGAVMDPDHWAITYRITPERFSDHSPVQLARDEIAADIAERDADNATRAALKALPEAESEAA
jgi:hypothetical protein